MTKYSKSERFRECKGSFNQSDACDGAALEIRDCFKWYNVGWNSWRDDLKVRNLTINYIDATDVYGNVDAAYNKHSVGYHNIPGHLTEGIGFYLINKILS